MSEPKYPDVSVNLSGEEANGFFIVARVRRALKRHGVPQEDVDKFQNEATSGNYDHLLKTCMEYVDVT